jgi:pyruvate formate lyase activating enzyme
MRDAGVWIELTNLIIPGINDDMGMIRQMCKWMVENNLIETPLHFSRFFPRYRMKDIPPTPIKTLETAKKVAIEEGLKSVYLGNV